METVSFKLQSDILKKVDSLLKPLHFNNRTEFIREAVRDKLQQEEKDEFLLAIRTFQKKNKARGKNTSDVRLREIREEAGNEIMKKFGLLD